MIIAARICSTLSLMEVCGRKFGTDLHERRLHKSTNLSEPPGSMLAPPTQVCVQQKLQRFLAMLFSAECFEYYTVLYCTVTAPQDSAVLHICKTQQVWSCAEMYICRSQQSQT